MFFKVPVKSEHSCLIDAKSPGNTQRILGLLIKRSEKNNEFQESKDKKKVYIKLKR